MTKVWYFNAFTVGNEHEQKTFTTSDLSTALKKSSIIFKIIFASHAITIHTEEIGGSMTTNRRQREVRGEKIGGNNF